MQRVIHSLYYFTAAAAAALVFIGLRVLSSEAALAVEWKLTLLLGAALLCLLMGVAGMAVFFRLRGQLFARPPLGMLFLLAYLVPMAALLLPEWAARQAAGGVSFLSLFSPSFTAIGQPWNFLWQISILSSYALLRAGLFAPSRPLWTGLRARFAPRGLSRWDVALALLTGLGVWLLAAFTIGLLRPSFSLAADTSLPGLLRAAVLLAAVLAAPFVETDLFWGVIQPGLQERLDPRLSAVSSALIFAAVQFRPLLFLPAFFLGLAQYMLIRRGGQLFPAVLAQMLFNLFLFLLGWYMVV